MKTANRALGLRTSAPAAGAPFWQMLNPAQPVANFAQEVRSLTVVLATAVQSEILLIRASTNGTQTSPVEANNLRAAFPSSQIVTAKFATTWSAAPTIGTNTPLFRATLPATVGGAIQWTFDEGEFLLTPSQSILLWNAGAGAAGALDVSCTFWGS